MAIRLTTYEDSRNIPDLPGTNIFHSTALFRVLEQTPGYHPTLLVASEAGKPIGKLLCITRYNFRMFHFIRKTYVYGTGEYFSSRYKREEIFNEMLSYFTSRLGNDSFLIEFHNLEEPLFGYKYFRKNHYFPVKWLRVRNSIHHATIDKWMSPSRKRQIARGLQNGATMETAKSTEEVTEFFKMLKKYYSHKIYRYLPDLNFFLHLQAHPEQQHYGNIFLIRYKHKIIGGAVCLYSGDTAYLIFSGGMRKSYAPQYPGVLAVWKAMIHARQLGFKHFEFMDAGLPFRKFGYRDFILRFGGKQLSSRRWFKVKWNWLNRLLIRLYI